MADRRRRWVIPLAVFLVVFGIHVGSSVTSSFDSRWSLYIALSLLHRGDTNLDEYGEVIAREQGYAIEQVGRQSYSIYPVGASLLAMPFMLVVEQYDRVVRGLDLDQRIRANPNLPAHLERQVASVVMAVTAVVIYSMGLQLLASPWRAVVLVLVFAFGTAAWSTVSRAMWQHTPSVLCLAVALRALLAARAQPRWLPLGGFALAFAYVSRPTNSLSLLGLSALVLRRHRSWAWWYLLAVAVVLMPFAAFNWTVYGALLSPYYRGVGFRATDNLLEAMTGNLASPARGLFVFSPVLLFAVPGAVMRLRAVDRHELDGWLIAILLAHWGVVSSIWPWWAGDSFGPRFFADMLPYLVYFLAPVVAKLSWSGGIGARALTIGFAASLLVSVLIHGRAATSRQGYAWNNNPVPIDRDPGRLWDWRDPQFMRGWIRP